MVMDSRKMPVLFGITQFVTTAMLQPTICKFSGVNVKVPGYRLVSKIGIFYFDVPCSLRVKMTLFLFCVK